MTEERESSPRQSPETRESAGRCTWDMLLFSIRTHRTNFGVAREGEGASGGLGEPELSETFFGSSPGHLSNDFEILND